MKNKYSLIKSKAWVVLSFILMAVLVTVFFQNARLKGQIDGLEGEHERAAVEGVNDFTLIIIDRLKTCQPVTLRAGEKSATVIDIACEVNFNVR